MDGVVVRVVELTFGIVARVSCLVGPAVVQLGCFAHDLDDVVQVRLGSSELLSLLSFLGVESLLFFVIVLIVEPIGVVQVQQLLALLFQ